MVEPHVDEKSMTILVSFRMGSLIALVISEGTRIRKTQRYEVLGP